MRTRRGVGRSEGRALFSALAALVELRVWTACRLGIAKRGEWNLGWKKWHGRGTHKRVFSLYSTVVSQ